MRSNKKLLQRENELLNILERDIFKFIDHPKNKDLTGSEIAVICIEISANLLMKTIHGIVPDTEGRISVLSDIYKSGLLHFGSNINDEKENKNELH